MARRRRISKKSCGGNGRSTVEQPAIQAGLKPPQLEFVASEFRSITAPLLRAVQDINRHSPERPVTVVLPELVEGRWWGYFMHANRERRLRVRLLQGGGPRVIVSSVPWQLAPTDPHLIIAEEEPRAQVPNPATASSNA